MHLEHGEVCFVSVHFNGHFPGGSALASYQNILDFIETKDDGSGGDNWSYKRCKAPVRLSPPTNQRQAFYRLDALPVAQPTVSEHQRKKSTEGRSYDKYGFTASVQSIKFIISVAHCRLDFNSVDL